jgi:hypothetical protein
MLPDEVTVRHGSAMTGMAAGKRINVIIYHDEILNDDWIKAAVLTRLGPGAHEVVLRYTDRPASL